MSDDLILFFFNNYFHRMLCGDNHQHVCAQLMHVLFHYLAVVQILFVAMIFPCYAYFSSIKRAMVVVVIKYKFQLYALRYERMMCVDVDVNVDG